MRSQRNPKTTLTWSRRTQFWYNLIRIHKTLRVTPAMESGIVDHLFSFEDLIGIVDEWEAQEKPA